MSLLYIEYGVLVLATGKVCCVLQHTRRPSIQQKNCRAYQVLEYHIVKRGRGDWVGLPGTKYGIPEKISMIPTRRSHRTYHFPLLTE